MLLRAGASSASALADGRGALFLAAANGHEQMLRVLIQHGADVEQATSKMGATALFAAVTGGQRDAVATLLELGADPLTEHADGVGLADRARAHGHAEIAALLDKATSAEQQREGSGPPAVDR